MIREGRHTRLGLWFYNRDEHKSWLRGGEWMLHPTIAGWYLGQLAKGWWNLGPGSINRHFEVEVAIGGEDNMLQAGLVLPFLGRIHAGVRVPRRLTRGWIYQRREWTIRIGYIGRWLEVMFASDEHMRDTGMASYYKAERERGEELFWSHAALWPGIHLTLHPRPLDFVFGRKECHVTESDPQPVVVPMPEGNYPGHIKREDRVWKRRRWPWVSHRRRDYWIDMEVGIPTPGKGENSWDIDDDAIYGTGGQTPHDAIANVTRAALRQRENYAGPGWEPTGGWPAGVAR